MSSKKVHTTISLPAELLAAAKADAEKDQRTVSFIVEEELRRRYRMPWGQGKLEMKDADKKETK